MSIAEKPPRPRLSYPLDLDEIERENTESRSNGKLDRSYG